MKSQHNLYASLSILAGHTDFYSLQRYCSAVVGRARSLSRSSVLLTYMVLVTSIILVDGAMLYQKRAAFVSYAPSREASDSLIARLVFKPKWCQASSSRAEVSGAASSSPLCHLNCEVIDVHLECLVASRKLINFLLHRLNSCN